MKKWLSFFVLTLCLLLGLAAQTGAASPTYLPYEGAAYQLTYQENDDGTVTITGTTGTREGQLVLPETIDGKPVTAIGSYAFQNRSGFTGELIIPDTVTSIGNYAFDGCTGLTGSLDLTGITDIGDGIFRNCAGFTNLTLDGGMTSIGNSAFRYCTGFAGSTLSLPDSITKIGENAFASCGFIGELTLGADLTSIGSAAFMYCGPFTGDLTIPDGVTEIGTATFAQCGFTGNLTLSSNLRSIGLNAFSECGFTGDLVIPDSVTEIGESAFDGCTGFTGSLTLGCGLSSIGRMAFRSTNFTGSLTIPNSVTEIGEYAFQNCDGFTGSLTIAGAQDIGAYAFHNCTGFTGDLTITGTGSTVIRRATFISCTGFTGNLTITGVTEIGASAFERCSGFTGLTLGQGLEIIYQNAFRDCTGFTGDLIIPDSVTLVEYNAFRDCTGFTGNLTVGGGSLTEIGEYAFHNCTGFTGNLTIGGSALIIGKDVFSGCTGFTGSLTIGDVSSIGENAFYGCTGFTGSLTLSGVDEIGRTAFEGCGFTGDLTILGNGAAVIDMFAFNRCKFTGTLSLSGVSEIKSGAFYGCSDLSGSLVLPDTLLTIGNQAFYECGFNGSLIFGSRLERIGQYAFRNCNGFTGDLILPDSVKEVGKGAFQSCSGFDGSLSLSRGLTLVDENVFRSCSGFTGTLTLPSGITSVGAYAFFGCAGFHALVLPPTLTEMGSDAFYGCSGLSGTLILPGSISEVASSAFEDCSGLSTLVLSDGIVALSNRAFLDCSGLTQIQLPISLTQINDSALHCSTKPDIPPTVLYSGSEEDWKAVSVNIEENNMLLGLHYGVTPVPPAEDTQRLGTVESVEDGAVTIDGLSYPLAEGLEANGAWAGEYVLYTVNSDGAVTSVTVLLRATGTLDDWVERLSPDPSTPAEPLVTLSGIDYDFSTLGDRSFLAYEDLLMGQRVVFYCDSTYTVYRIEPDPDTTVTRVGYVTGVTETDITIDAYTFLPGAEISLEEETYLDQYVRYELQGLNTLSALEVLPTHTGTLNAFDSLRGGLTIGEQLFSLSPLADVEPEELEAMVGDVISYVRDGEANVYHAERYVPDPSVFTEDIYRARFLQHPEIYAPAGSVADRLNGQTPGEIMLETMEEEGFTVGVAVWESVTFLADSISDISNVDKINVMPEDLFSAILLEALETSTQDAVSFGFYQDLSSIMNSVNDWLYLIYQTEDIRPAAMTESQQLQLANVIRNAFYKENPTLKSIANIGKVFQYINTCIKVYDSVNDCIITMYNNLYLYQMCDAMKEVVRTMYADARRYGYPGELQRALEQCIQIIDAASAEAFLIETALDVEAIAGEFSFKLLLSTFWKDLRTRTELMYPGLALVRASYMTTRLLCDAAFNTDDLSDQYWEILATTEVEHLIEATRATLATRFQYSGTVADARAYLSATDLLFSIRCLDCDSVLKYVEAADGAIVSMLLNAGFGINNEEFKGYVEGIRHGYEDGRNTARWGWIHYADEAYPGQGLATYYEALRDQEQELRKQVEAACPVTVSVYDADGDLAAYASEAGIASFDENVAVSLKGDTKTVSLFNRTDYRIVLSGSDAGTMDVAVTEYGAGETVDRTARFYDVALTAQSVYDLSDGNGAAYTLTKDGTQTVPALDTLTSSASVSATVVNGAFPVNGILLSELNAPGLQEITVTALPSKGYVFDGWSAEGGGTFADPSSPTTTFRLPESGSVTLKAAMSPLPFPEPDVVLDRSQALLRSGEQLALSVVSDTSSVVWTSMDPTVATVDDAGLVTAVKSGTTSIVAATRNGKSLAACAVTVRDYGAVSFTLLDSAGQPVQAIPAEGAFTVQADVAGGTLAYEDRCMLACYDADGRLVCLTPAASVELLSDDVTARLTFSVERSGQPVTTLKLFLLSSGQALQPLSEAAVWGG